MASTYRYLLLAALLGACVDTPGATVCATGIVCATGTTCAAAQPVCIVSPCGNGRVDAGESCDDGNILSGDGCSPSCGKEDCGNGDVEPGERCDDNNTANGDGCSADCLSLEECGNGIVDVKSGGAMAERCDDGNTVAGDGCRADCKEREFCNNGFLDPGEVCDDGMPTGGPCSPDCMSGLGCGNGFLDPGEQCDDGNTTDTDDCRFPSCKISVCGDGVTNLNGVLSEQCDGGTTGTPVETTTCNIDCTTRVCGDGKVNQTAGEQCDSGVAGTDTASCDMSGGTTHECTARVCGDDHVNTAASEQCDPGTPGLDVAACDNDCTAPACGDSHVNSSFTPPTAANPEGCDDGGTMPGDGCSAVCAIESCGNGVTETVNGEQCDDMDTDDTDNCRNNCQTPRCGDGVHSANATPAEPCDTSGDSQTCDADCSPPMCGDGYVNNQFTPMGGPGVEQCEDGNSNNGDGCSSSCRLEPFALAISKAGNGIGTVTSNPTGINCGSDCSEIYLSNQMVTITATPDPTATFGGFTGDCVGASPCTVTMSQSRSVIATFNANTLTVTKIGTGTGTVTGPNINCGMDCSETYNVGTMVMLVAAPNSDSIFGGWSGTAASCGMNTMCTVTVNQAATATAQFTLNTFTLSVTKTGSGTGSIASSPAGISCGATCSAGFTANTLVTLVPTADADSDFTSWSGACAGSGTCSVTMNAAKSVQATFTKKPATLTVTSSSGGKVTATGINCGSGNNDCGETYTFGTPITLTAVPDAKRAFVGWGGACASAGSATTCMITMDGPKTVSATFETNRLTVERDGTGSGTVTGPGISCGGNCTEDYDANTTVTLSANEGSDLLTAWSDAACNANTDGDADFADCQITVNGARTITVTFDDASTLSVNLGGSGSGTVSGTGIACPGDCTQKYPDNSSQMITAAPNAGSVFVSWSNCDNPSGTTCTMSMTTDKTVTANFSPTQFQLSVMIGGVGSGSVSSNPAGINGCTSGTCMADFNTGSTVMLTATPTGMNTIAWTGDCLSCGTNTMCSVSMTQARSCTASFTP